MPTPRLRHTARALLLDTDERILLARHDLTSRHYGRVLWAPPGGGLEPGETPVDAVLRELVEEVGHEATADQLRHVWHQEVVSASYSAEWDGAVHDYFLVRCEPFTPAGTSTSEQLAEEGITEFRWWTLTELDGLAAPAVLAPRQLPALLRDLLANEATDREGDRPIRI